MENGLSVQHSGIANASIGSPRRTSLLLLPNSTQPTTKAQFWQRNPLETPRQGELTLATRLHRLADLLQKDVTDIYAELGLDFQARWFPVLAAMRRHDSTSTTALARELALSHQAVSKTTKLLINKGLVAESPDPTDSRKRPLALTRKGRQLCKQLDIVWEEIRAANQNLLAETDGGFLDDLTLLEL